MRFFFLDNDDFSLARAHGAVTDSTVRFSTALSQTLLHTVPTAQRQAERKKQ